MYKKGFHHELHGTEGILPNLPYVVIYVTHAHPQGGVGAGGGAYDSVRDACRLAWR